MPEPANPTLDATTKRWDTIRANPKCDLSLAPASVASYLNTPESELVQERIRESLVQLVRYRLKKRNYVSAEPAGVGKLATCEGLEAFLVPAVEEAVPLSTILQSLNADEKVKFAETFVDDINDLLSDWKNSLFSGAPYADEDDIKDTLQPTKPQTVNIVEAAAMACRVIIHLITLKLTRGNEGEFQQAIGNQIDQEVLSAALKNALDFLIRSFQKGDGPSEREKIAHATVAGKPGSGWSWTDWAGLPPMLFFTAAAVDAFAELDLYVVRAVSGNNKPKGDGWQRLSDLYTEIEERFGLFQLCVDMARRWVQRDVLPNLSKGAGMHSEPGIEYKPDDSDVTDLKAELELEGLTEPPTRLYNTLYGLQVLLWSWADWDDRGTSHNEDNKSSINRALAQLVYNYDSVPAVKKLLRSPYVVFLPRSDYFQVKEDPKKPRPEYQDKGFLPLLTRLLVLFVVYGVGDRNLLEPVIRNLYVELLQNRYRKELGFEALWSSLAIEVFATQRAIQALTFYFAYARGKEQANAAAGEVGYTPTEDLHDRVIFRNRTGRPLVFETVGTLPDAEEPTRTNEPVPPFPDPWQAQDWSAYIKLLNVKLIAIVTDESETLRKSAAAKGKALFAQLKADTLKDRDLAKAVIFALACLYGAPSIDEHTRTLEFNALVELARQLGAP